MGDCLVGVLSMKTLMKFATAIALCAAAGSASAATFKFDGSGHATNQPFLSYADSGLTVSATAATYNGPGPVGSAVTFNPTTIDLNSWGLISKRGYNDEHVVDGRGKDEVILLDFGPERVTLTGARFRYTNGYNFSSNAKFDFFADGIFIGRSKYANAANIFDGVVGSIFGIGASKNSTGFKLAAVSAELAPVPLPASGLMLIAALAGAGAVMRRRKTA